MILQRTAEARRNRKMLINIHIVFGIDTNYIFFLSFLKRRKIFLCFLSFPSHFLFFLTLLSLSLSLLSTNTEVKARFLVLLKNLSFLRCTTQDGYDREYSSLLIVVVFAECDKKRCETTQHCRLFQFSRTMNVS